MHKLSIGWRLSGASAIGLGRLDKNEGLLWPHFYCVTRASPMQRGMYFALCNPESHSAMTGFWRLLSRFENHRLQLAEFSIYNESTRLARSQGFLVLEEDGSGDMNPSSLKSCSSLCKLANAGKQASAHATILAVN